MNFPHRVDVRARAVCHDGCLNIQAQHWEGTGKAWDARFPARSSPKSMKLQMTSGTGGNVGSDTCESLHFAWMLHEHLWDIHPPAAEIDRAKARVARK